MTKRNKTATEPEAPEQAEPEMVEPEAAEPDPIRQSAEDLYAAGVEAGMKAAREMAAQAAQAARQPLPAGLQTQTVVLSEGEMAAIERRQKQKEAAKAPHPRRHGALNHKQLLRDGTRVEGVETKKEGEIVMLPLPIEFDTFPTGKRIVGGKYDGKWL
jgi:hypothetical protein